MSVPVPTDAAQVARPGYPEVALRCLAPPAACALEGRRCLFADEGGGWTGGSGVWAETGGGRGGLRAWHSSAVRIGGRATATGVMGPLGRCGRSFGALMAPPAPLDGPGCAPTSRGAVGLRHVGCAPASCGAGRLRHRGLGLRGSGLRLRPRSCRDEGVGLHWVYAGLWGKREERQTTGRP